jgi:hypothetical protein
MKVRKDKTQQKKSCSAERCKNKRNFQNLFKQQLVVKKY